MDEHGKTSRAPLRFMLALKAARDFGLPDEDAAAIAVRHDPRTQPFDRLVDALATRLLERGAVVAPDAI